MHFFTESDVMIGDMGEASFSEYNLTMCSIIIVIYIFNFILSYYIA